MFACRFFEKDGLFAACDKEILGKTLKFGEVDFEIKKSFYFEKFVGVDEIKEFWGMAKIINLVGNRVVKLSIEEKLINKESVKIIDGVPHVQIYRM